MCLIVSAESDRYSGIWNKLKDSNLLGTYNYPKTTTIAYYVLCLCKKPAPPRQVNAPPAEVTFVQSGDTEKNKTTSGNDERSFLEVTCYCCQQTGHYAGNCPSSTANTRTGTQSLQVGLNVTQITKEAPTTNIIKPKWILLYTCSTTSATRNKILVQNIQP